MADYPAIPIFTDAWLADTDHLSDAEQGRYWLLVMHMWRAPGQRFPNDDRWLARKFRRSVEDVRTQLRPVIDEFFKTDANWITHKRIKREFLFVKTKSQKRSAAAKARWEKEKNSTVAMHPHPHPHPHSSEQNGVSESDPKKSKIGGGSEGSESARTGGDDVLPAVGPNDKPGRRRQAHPPASPIDFLAKKLRVIASE